MTSGNATSADATYSNEFLELRGEWLWGDRTDIAYRGDARTFMAAWGIFAVRFPVAHVLAMPTARFEWLDADRQQSGGQRYLLSGALNLDFTAHVRLLLDLVARPARLRPPSRDDAARRVHAERHHLRHPDPAEGLTLEPDTPAARTEGFGGTTGPHPGIEACSR